MILALGAGTASLAAPAGTAPAASPRAERYIVEFRARPGGVAGHSYVVYGKADASGRMRRMDYASFRPDDGAFGFIVGSLAVYAGTFAPSEDDLSAPVTTLYRRVITASQYRKLVAHVAKARANPQLWNLVGNNCNDFVSSLAEAIGLRTPSTLLPPDGFIDALKSYNEP